MSDRKETPARFFDKHLFPRQNADSVVDWLSFQCSQIRSTFSALDLVHFFMSSQVVRRYASAPTAAFAGQKGPNASIEISGCYLLLTAYNRANIP